MDEGGTRDETREYMAILRKNFPKGFLLRVSRHILREFGQIHSVLFIRFARSINKNWSEEIGMAQRCRKKDGSGTSFFELKGEINFLLDSLFSFPHFGNLIG